MSPPTVRPIVTPELLRQVVEAMGGHPTYPAQVAAVVDIRSRERVA